MQVQHMVVEGKNVYIVENHAWAIAAWAEVRRDAIIAPLLISFDCHTDTFPAFTKYSVDIDGDFHTMKAKAIREDERKKIDFRLPSSVIEAAQKLANEEQIDAAIQSDILRCAFIVQYSDSGDETVPGDRIFIVPAGCAVDCSKLPHDDSCNRIHYDQAIESSYLKGKYRIIRKMAASISIHDVFETVYILDIDLDYFRTMKAINPDNASLFHMLIRCAKAITIATETDYVEMCKIDEDEPITSDRLLAILLDHIHYALSN